MISEVRFYRSKREIELTYRLDSPGVNFGLTGNNYIALLLTAGEGTKKTMVDLTGMTTIQFRKAS